MTCLRIGFIIAFVFLSFTIANRTNRNLNLQQLQNRCLTHQSTAPKSLTCITQKKLKMQITRGVENGVFYCLTYEKNTGNVYGFDSLTIELHPDYDLQYSGANVIDYEFPSFKLYDARVTEEYKGRFAIYSNNTSFRIYQVTINNEPQSCAYGKGKNRQLWPNPRKIDDVSVDEDEVQTTQKSAVTPTKNIPATSTISTTAMPRSSTINKTTKSLAITTTLSAIQATAMVALTTEQIPNTSEFIPKSLDFTTESVIFTTIQNEANLNEQMDLECGVIQKVIDLKQFLIPYNPGEFPFAASIFEKINFEHARFKCSGTIVSNDIILTSVNCLLDKNSKLLKEYSLVVYAAQYLSNTQEINSSRAYQVDRIIIHENFNFNLDNNIAALKMKRVFEFNEFIQPICLPDPNVMAENDILSKLVGFGKPNSMLAENDILITVEQSCRDTRCQLLYGNLVLNESNIDLGCGLYLSDEKNRWTLIGIISELHEINLTITNVNFYTEWIEKLFK